MNDKQKLLIKKYKYYLMHGTTLKNLRSILKSGYIVLGNNINVIENQFGNKNNVIYMSIYFEKLKNIKKTFYFELLLHPKILFDHDISFNGGWGFSRNIVNIKKNDNDNIISNKIKKYMNMSKIRIFLNN